MILLDIPEPFHQPHAMRLLILSLFLIAISGVHASDVLPYPMRDIPIESDKFRKVLLHVNATALHFFRVQNEPNTLDLIVVQNLKDDRYLCRVEERVILLIGYDSPKAIADGDTISVPVTATNETYEYQTTAGSMKTVHILKAVEDPPILSPEEFVEKLKSGERFLFTTAQRNTACYQCRGTGKGNMRNGRVLCDRCEGRGILDDPIFFHAVW